MVDDDGSFDRPEQEESRLEGTEFVEIPIILTGDLADLARPDERPVVGDRRLVRLIPTPLGSRPALWISPYTIMEQFEDGMHRARKILVLLSKGPPRPDTACVTIPEAAIDKFPLVPVEW